MFEEFKINLNNNVIVEATKSAWNLGFQFDSSFKFEKQISEICRDCLYYTKLLAKNKDVMNKDTRIKVATAYIMSRLNYCCVLYAGLPNCTLDKLQRVQNCIARVVTDTPFREHITPVLKSLGWLSIRQFIEYRILIIVYQCINCIMPSYMYDLFKFSVKDRDLRGNYKFLLVVPKVRTKFGERSLSYLGPKFWNALPFDVKMSTTLLSFKRKVKEMLFNRSS